MFRGNIHFINATDIMRNSIDKRVTSIWVLINGT